MALHTILTPKWITWGKLVAAENPRLEGFVPSEGGENPRILLLGEAPGDKEVKIGRPFMGPSGKELDRWLESLGLTREDIYITGVVNSRPFSIGKTGRKSDRRPNQAEVKKSAPMFDWELAHFPNVIGSDGQCQSPEIAWQQGQDRRPAWPADGATNSEI